MAQRGRPASNGPVVVVSVGQATVAWCAGEFAGDPDLVKAAEWNTLIGRRVRPHPCSDAEFEAGSGDPLSAAAAMLGVDSQAVLREAPETVWDALSSVPDIVDLNDDSDDDVAVL